MNQFHCDAANVLAALEALMNRMPSGCDLSDMSDEMLAKQAKNGDDQALTALIDRYIPLVRTRACAFSGNGLEAEDLSQEGMIALLKAVRNYREDAAGNFKTFATVCVNNKLSSALTAYMREKNAPMRGYVSLSEEDSLGGILAVPDLQSDPESLLIHSEEARARNHRIETLLSPFERQVLKLYLSSFSYDEMSRQLGSSTKAVDNALQRVRRKLRNVFIAE